MHVCTAALIGLAPAPPVGIAPNDPALEPYFALAEELDLPVLIHMLGIGPYMPSFRVSAGNPLLLEDVLVRHPKLRLFTENAGYPYRGEMIAIMTQYPHLYTDVSTITWVIPREAFYDHLEALVRAGLGKRVMFGSDQMRWPDKIETGIRAIEEAPFLTAAQKRDILYHNAARFIRLEEAASRAAVEPSTEGGARDARPLRERLWQRALVGKETGRGATSSSARGMASRRSTIASRLGR